MPSDVAENANKIAFLDPQEMAAWSLEIRSSIWIYLIMIKGLKPPSNKISCPNVAQRIDTISISQEAIAFSKQNYKLEASVTK